MSDFQLGFSFAPTPQAAMRALAVGAIDAIDLAIISVLWGGANWQTRQVTMTLEWLGERIDWKLTEDALYRRVTKLGRQGWHSYVTSPGKHGARYVFRLDPAPKASSERSEDDPRSETLNHEERQPLPPRSVPRRASPGPRSDQAPNPQQEPDSASTREAPIPRTSERQRETKAGSEEKALGPGSARDHDHVVGEATPEEHPVVGMTENGRGAADDLHSMIERARQAQAREPVRFVIEPEDAEAEVALLAEVEELLDEGKLDEVEP